MTITVPGGELFNRDSHGVSSYIISEGFQKNRILRSAILNSLYYLLGL